MNRVLVLGGYGVFGRRIVSALLKNGLAVVINGRHRASAEAFRDELGAHDPSLSVDIAIFDVEQSLAPHLMKLKPRLVINTCGPFQLKDYGIATLCIKHKIHYIDLADAMEYVEGISILDESAKSAGVVVVSGASTVPGLSSAVIEYVRPRFNSIDSLVYGISPGQKAPRGLATAESILTYLGRPLSQRDEDQKPRYGWQNLYRQEYPDIGRRWMASCDVPDIQLFAQRYQIKHLHFSAGMESTSLHFGMWFMSIAVRCGIPLPLMRYSKGLLKLSHFFDRWGSSDGGMHMIFRGTDLHGHAKELKWFIIAKQGDGPQIPSTPAVLLAKKILNAEGLKCGAMPCMGLFTLPEFLQALYSFDIKTYEVST